MNETLRSEIREMINDSNKTREQLVKDKKNKLNKQGAKVLFWSLLLFGSFSLTLLFVSNDIRLFGAFVFMYFTIASMIYFVNESSLFEKMKKEE